MLMLFVATNGQTVSPSIIVDQFGYLPEADKEAVILKTHGNLLNRLFIIKQCIFVY